MNSALQTKYPFIIQQKEQSITFRSVSLNKDFDRLYKWMHEPHVIPYWNLNISKQAYEQHLKTFLADSHQKLLIGEIDGVPMSYWESYTVDGDIISNYYPYEKRRSRNSFINWRTCFFEEKAIFIRSFLVYYSTSFR